MAEAILSIIFFFNVVLVIIYFIMRIHRHTVTMARKDPVEAGGEKKKNSVPRA